MWKNMKKPICVLVFTNLFYPSPIPLQKRAIYEQNMMTDAFFPLLVFQASIRNTKTSSDVYLYPLKAGIFLVLRIQRAASTCLSGPTSTKKREPQGI